MLMRTPKFALPPFGAKASQAAGALRRPRLLVVGPLPPPLGGVQLIIDMQLRSSLARAFELHPVDTSKRELRWAVLQFQREEVLFREAERLEIGLWLKRLLRDKEPLPSVGQAFFCFLLIVALRWLAPSTVSHASMPGRGTSFQNWLTVTLTPRIIAIVVVGK